MPTFDDLNIKNFKLNYIIKLKQHMCLMYIFIQFLNNFHKKIQFNSKTTILKNCSRTILKKYCK